MKTLKDFKYEILSDLAVSLVKSKYKLEQENAELKKRLEKQQEENYSYESQLKEIRTLNKGEVRKIINKITLSQNEYHHSLAKAFAITEICKLAIPKIDKEKIIAAIDRWVFGLSETYTDFDLIEPYDVNKLANEIVRKLEAPEDLPKFKDIIGLFKEGQ